MTHSTITLAISDQSVVKAADDQVASKLADELIILDVKAGIYYGLNPLGARIWELIQTPQTVQEIQQAILAEYEVDPERCKADLLALLQDLSEKGLVEIEDEG